MARLLSLRGCRLRSVYATANLYGAVGSAEDVYDRANIVRCTPTWDVDSSLGNWRETLAVAREIASLLEMWGVEESVYIKWSGNGCHVHLHEEAISPSLTEKHHPLDLAYAIVEYVRMKVSPKLPGLSPQGRVKVENRMDPTRVFTCPLSLHRRLDVVCIAMKPDDLDDFTQEWVDVAGYRHSPEWRRHVEGEADGIAVAAYKVVGGYPSRPRRRRRHPPLDEQIRRWLGECR